MPEPNATPAQLTMTPADEAADRELLRYCSLHRMPVDTSMVDRAWAECDATRAKLAEAEAQRDALVNAQPQVCVCETDPTRELQRKLTAAESRVAALTEALETLADDGEQYIQDCLAAWDRAGQREARDDFRAAMTSARAALSPSQPTQGGA